MMLDFIYGQNSGNSGWTMRIATIAAASAESSLGIAIHR